jgi:selenocysteine-specific elongation factor
MIVGTAGHIDHGKTSLIQALTGVNTDRLIEEKRRGMTIELGFAQMLFRSNDANEQVVSNEHGISFIDVPGHEKLVRTMLAGASSIDFAMLLIAADDGVMPQTLEHLSILNLLDIQKGCIVITKVDKVDPEIITQRIEEAKEVIKKFELPDYLIQTVSVQNGQGLNELKNILSQASLASQQNMTSTTSHYGFKMGLDRSFSLDGIGTVVAGTVQGGLVQVGDHLCLADQPHKTYRVRSLQVHSKEVKEALPGQRTAVALVGLERNEVNRGQMLCSSNIAVSTTRIDAVVELSKNQEKPIRSGTVVHLHCGTQERMGTLAVLGKDSIAPGEKGFVQLVLQRPIYLWNGDRIILRNSAATQTIAGGKVLEAQGPNRYRQTPERLNYLSTQLETNFLERLFLGLPFAPYGVILSNKLLTQGIDPETRLIELIRNDQDCAKYEQQLNQVFLSQDQVWMIDLSIFQDIKNRILKLIAEHHEKHPDMLGILQSRVKLSFGIQMTEDVWSRILQQMVQEKILHLKNGFILLPQHAQTIRDADLRISQRVLPLIDEGGFDPPWVRDLARTMSISEMQMRMTLQRLASMGELYQIVKDLFYHPRQVERMTKIIQEIVSKKSQEPNKAGVTAAEFRDATGLGRKRAIQILEFFDKIGFCRRIGDVHLIRVGNVFLKENIAPPK